MLKRVLLPVVAFFSISCYSMNESSFMKTIEENILDKQQLVSGLQRIAESKKADANLARNYLRLYGGNATNSSIRGNLLASLSEQEKNIVVSAARRVALANYNCAKRSLFEIEHLQEANRLYQLLEKDCKTEGGESDIIGSYFKLTKEELDQRVSFFNILYLENTKIEGPLFAE